MYLCMYVCMYIYTYIHKYIHTYIHTCIADHGVRAEVQRVLLEPLKRLLLDNVHRY